MAQAALWEGMRTARLLIETRNRSAGPGTLRRFCICLTVFCALSILAAGCGGGGGGGNGPFTAHTESNVTTNPFVTPANAIAVEDVAGRYTLSWDPVAGADRYEISINGDGEGRVITATAATYIDTSVISSKKNQYVYSVSACNGTACSWKKKATLLFYPTNLAASDLDNKVSAGVNLNWDAVSGATSYTIYRNCGTAGEKSFTATSGPITDTGVIPQTTYSYCISACTTATCSVKSPEASVTTGSVYEIPSAPTGVTATAKSPFVIEMNWGAVTLAEYYTVYVSVAGSADSTQLAYAMPFQLTGLTKDSVYTLAVSACNARTCSAKSATVQATTMKKQTITVDSSVSTVSLANAVPIGVSTTGSYNISYSIGANKTSSVSNQDAYYFMSAAIYSYTPATGADKIALTPVSWLVASTLSLNATDSRAILIEAESTSDNGGFSVLTFSQAGKTPINTALAGFGNSVQLTSSNAREITSIELPAGTYSFSLTSSTMPESHDGDRKFEQILLYYVSTTGFGMVKALDTTAPVSVTKNGGSMYAFFLDDDPGSVTGSVTLEITP